MQLTKTQRSYLRGLANGLPVTVTVGKLGLNAAVIEKTRRELAAHELIKLRFLDFFEQQHELTGDLAAAADAVAVAVIGHTAILYRPHDDAERRRIALPAGGQPWNGQL